MKSLLTTTALAGGLLMFGAALPASADKATPALKQVAAVDYVSVQSDQQLLASDLIGRTVTNPAGETLGDINDLVIAMSTAGSMVSEPTAAGLSSDVKSDAPAATTTSSEGSDKNESMAAHDATMIHDTTMAHGTNVIIGVGGFLGIAVSLDSLQVMRDDGGDLRVVLDATQASLESAPEYRPLKISEVERLENKVKSMTDGTDDSSAKTSGTVE